MREYRYLLPALQSLQEGEWLLAKDIAPGGVKRYYIYDSIDQFLREQEKHRKHYYEILNGKVRIYMDLDITSPEPLESVESLLQLLKDAIEQRLPGTIINIYQSPSIKGYSFHIVLWNQYANTVLDSKKEVEQIIAKISNPLKRYIDLKVYKSNQLFRMLGSSKIDTGNIKLEYEILSTHTLQDSLVLPIYLTTDMNLSNAINILSRLLYVDQYLYDYLNSRDLHPDWFAYYMNGDIDKPISLLSKIFWKLLLSAAVKVQNYPLVENILMKESPLMTADEKGKLKKYLENNHIPRTYIDLIPSD